MFNQFLPERYFILYHYLITVFKTVELFVKHYVSVVAGHHGEHEVFVARRQIPRCIVPSTNAREGEGVTCKRYTQVR